MRRLLSLILLVTASTTIALADDPAPHKEVPLPAEPVIDDLILQLGRPNFRERTIVAERLKQMREARPYLERALKSADPQVAESAAQILRAFPKLLGKLDPARLERVRKLAEGARIDLAISGLCALKTDAAQDLRYWRLAFDMAAAIHSRAVKRHGHETEARIAWPYKSVEDFLQINQAAPLCALSAAGLRPAPLFAFIQPPATRNGRRFIIHENRGAANFLHETIFLCEGDAMLLGHCRNSIVIIDGHLEKLYEATNSVIIINGTMKTMPVEHRDKDYVTGDGFVINYGIKNSIIICSGKYRHNDKRIATKSCFNDQIEQPLGFVKWFTIAEVGLEVSLAPSGRLQVDKLHEGKAARKAGLDLGDVIAAVDGVQIDGQESFRRRLMRGVVNERCTLTVKRGTMSLEVPLDFRAEERAKEKAKQVEKK